MDWLKKLAAGAANGLMGGGGMQPGGMPYSSGPGLGYGGGGMPYPGMAQPNFPGMVPSFDPNMGPGAFPGAGGGAPGGGGEGGGIGGWWSGLEGMEQAQLIAAALGTGANIYGQHQAGKAQDRAFEEEKGRYEESIADRDRRRRQRADALGTFLPTASPESDVHEERRRRRQGPPPRQANPNFL